MKKNFSFSLSLEEQKIQENDNNENKFTISQEFSKFGARKFGHYSDLITVLLKRASDTMEIYFLCTVLRKESGN